MKVAVFNWSVGKLVGINFNYCLDNYFLLFFTQNKNTFLYSINRINIVLVSYLASIVYSYFLVEVNAKVGVSCGISTLYLHNARTTLGYLPNAVNYLNVFDNIVFYSMGIAMETRNV